MVIVAEPTTKQQTDVQRVRVDLADLFADGQPRELMAVTTGRGIQSAIVDSVQDAVRIIEKHDRDTIAGWYTGVNPVDLPCRPMSSQRANGTNVPTLTALFLDFDVRYGDGEKRAATDEELALTVRCRDRVRSQLVTNYGFPVEAMRSGTTGNGSMLLYRLPDLTNNSENLKLIADATRTAAALVDAEFPGVKFDAGVKDAIRVRRISGTVNRRAASPQRLCDLEIVADAEPVSLDALKDLAAQAKSEPPGGSSRTGEIALTDEEIDAIVDVLKPAWHAGNRHNASRAVAGYLWHLGADLDTAAVIVDRLLVKDLDPDDRRKTLADTYARGERGDPVAWHDDLKADVSEIQFGRIRQLKRDIHEARGSTLIVGDGHTGGSGDDETVWEIIPPERERRTWPVLHSAALHGLAGAVVDAIDPTTEGDPVAVLEFFLTAFGNACGRNAYVTVGNDKHGANHYVVLVGESSKSRKGNSRGGGLDLMRRADPDWTRFRVLGGLSSGEGLIWAVRDRVERENKKGEREVFDEGVSDKRLLCIEDEFSRVFKVAGRQGSTITEIMRQAWDGRDALRVMVKGDTNTASGAHVAIFGNVTEQELILSLSETDMTNGMANRFRWPVVRRSKLIARPRRMAEDIEQGLADRIAAALRFAREAGELDFSEDALPLWEQVYHDELSNPVRGIVGSLTARADAITLRLSLTYALLDQCCEIRPEHLRAALAVWAYSEQSVRYLFGDKTGDWVADRILHILKVEGSKKHIEIVEAFGRNQSAARIQTAIELLNGWDRIVVMAPKKTGTAGRPATIYALVPDRAA